MRHQVNHATFALPELLKDRTMHAFATVGDEAGECSLVMSHADVSPGKTLASFTDELLARLASAMPGFSLLSSSQRMIVDIPAIDLAYRWRSGLKWLHQRQVAALVPCAETGSMQAVLIAASCPHEFADKWSGTIESIFASVKLRTIDEPAAGDGDIVPAITTSAVFALCASRSTLHAFISHDDACLNTDAYEVQQDAWRFFDATGKPLRARFLVPVAWWRKPGQYVLDAMPDTRAPSLRDQLHCAHALVCHSTVIGLSSIAEVRTSLDKLTEE